MAGQAKRRLHREQIWAAGYPLMLPGDPEASDVWRRELNVRSRWLGYLPSIPRILPAMAPTSLGLLIIAHELYTNKRTPT
ncbi:hypothetical protein XELAEV_18018381mg [Xenopus laevis]|uniref:Uncharacterized protein n=1 Tax=Xenopus laevis TaxID=8355 RepID=A0A974DCV9_XENLA|nr:hypothetical protein XELAEV_18018381mg [Xenopus laevis]